MVSFHVLHAARLFRQMSLESESSVFAKRVKHHTVLCLQSVMLFSNFYALCIIIRTSATSVTLSPRKPPNSCCMPSLRPDLGNAFRLG